MPVGLDAQFGFKAESTWGTPVTVDEFLPLVSERVIYDRPPLASSAMLGSGKLVQQAAQENGGQVAIGGDVGLELYVGGIRTILKHMMGTESGAGPYTYTPATLQGMGLTCQFGKPSTTAVHPFTFSGCKVSSWEIAATAGEVVTLGLTLIGKDVTTATGLAAVSYAANATKPFKAVNTTVTVGGASRNVKQLTLSGDNKLTARHFLGSAYTAEPLQDGGFRDYTGTLVCQFTDLTDYTSFVSQSQVAIVTTFTSGSSSLAITMNAKFRGETPAVGGGGPLDHNLTFACLSTGADSSAISIVYTP